MEQFKIDMDALKDIIQKEVNNFKSKYPGIEIDLGITNRKISYAGQLISNKDYVFVSTCIKSTDTDMAEEDANKIIDKFLG